MKRLAPHRLPLLLLLILLPCVWGAFTAHAQFFYFGRNKVQYTDFDWRVLKTEHFDIHYYVEMKELAERGARLAEESYTLLEQKFNHTVNVRIPLIFYSSHIHFEQTNTTEGFIPEGVGGFFEFLKGRVVIPADGSVAEFRHVIRHELVHVFMTSKIAHVLSDHRKVGDRSPPLWFSEGLAEYWSTEWDGQGEMVMRDAVLNGSVVGLDDMDRIYGTFMMYKEGQNALGFLSRTFGEEKILLLMENFWKEASFSDVFRITIGKDYRAFDEMWLYELKKQYYPLMAGHDAPSMAAVTVAREGFSAKPVVYEGDSVRTVYFIGNRTGYTGIYRKNLDEKDPRVTADEVLQGEKTDEFESFHPFQSRIDVSADGRLAFVTKSGEHDALHIYDLRTDEVLQTFRFKDLVSIGSTSWSPDCKQIVFSAINSAGDDDLYILTPATKELQRLTDDYYDDRDPAWSPRGDVIAFSSDRGPAGPRGVYNLFLYTISSGRIDYLTCDSASAGAPAWSKDSTKLAFTSELGGVKNIWVIDFTKSAPGAMRPMTRLTNFTTPAFDPAWTRSGDLVFGTFEKLSFQIREIKDVAKVLDTASVVRPIDIYNKESPWEARTLSGVSEIKRPRYKGEYSLDVAESAISTDPVFGTVGGAIVALSDLLGNDQYYFLLYNTAESQADLLSSFNIAISHVSMGQRTNYAYGIYRFTGRRYDLTVSDDYYYERVYGGYFAMSYPLSKFERIETSMSLSNSDRELVGDFVERRALLLSNSISFIHDNSLWGPSGPLDGNAFSLTLAYTSDVQYSNVNYYTIIADYRNYLRLATRSAFASRFWLFYNDGRESRRFVMGGSWDLRGWPLWSIRGEKLWLTSQELRFPFIDQFAVRFPFGGLSFWSIRGALFFDAGSAWDTQYTQTYGSVGGGLRMNLGGVLVLRYDIGKRIENNFTSLQNGLFTQFFFGWDF